MMQRPKSKLGGEIDRAADHGKETSNNDPHHEVTDPSHGELPKTDSEALREQNGIAYQQTPNGTFVRAESVAAVDVDTVPENDCNAENRGYPEDTVMENG